MRPAPRRSEARPACVAARRPGLRDRLRRAVRADRRAHASAAWPAIGASAGPRASARRPAAGRRWRRPSGSDARPPPGRRACAPWQRRRARGSKRFERNAPAWAVSGSRAVRRGADVASSRGHGRPSHLRMHPVAVHRRPVWGAASNRRCPIHAAIGLRRAETRIAPSFARRRVRRAEPTACPSPGVIEPIACCARSNGGDDACRPLPSPHGGRGPHRPPGGSTFPRVVDMPRGPGSSACPRIPRPAGDDGPARREAVDARASKRRPRVRCDPASAGRIVAIIAQRHWSGETERMWPCLPTLAAEGPERVVSGLSGRTPARSPVRIRPSGWSFAVARSPCAPSSLVGRRTASTPAVPLGSGGRRLGRGKHAPRVAAGLTMLPACGTSPDRRGPRAQAMSR